MNDCLKRKLDDTYLVIYAIRNEINIKKGEYIINVKIFQKKRKLIMNQMAKKQILKEKIIMKITNKTKQNNLKNIKEKKQYYKRKNITFQNYFCSINSYKK